MEAINMMIELVGSTHSQGESTSRYLRPQWTFQIDLKLIFHFFLRMFVDAIVIWQSKSDIGNVVIGATINAIGTCKTLSMNLLVLLEATTFNYFRHLGRFLCIILKQRFTHWAFFRVFRFGEEKSFADVAQRLWTTGSKIAGDRFETINRSWLSALSAPFHHLQTERATG